MNCPKKYIGGFQDTFLNLDTFTLSWLDEPLKLLKQCLSSTISFVINDDNIFVILMNTLLVYFKHQTTAHVSPKLMCCHHYHCNSQAKKYTEKQLWHDMTKSLNCHKIWRQTGGKREKKEFFLKPYMFVHFILCKCPVLSLL